MGYYNPDPYYQPEQFGLVPVAELDYSDGCWQFDLRVVWRHADTGVLYTARDAGCSCPSPFETYHALADLEQLNLAALEAEVKGEQAGEYSYVDALEARDFLREVRRAAAPPVA